MSLIKLAKEQKESFYHRHPGLSIGTAMGLGIIAPYLTHRGNYDLDTLKDLAICGGAAGVSSGAIIAGLNHRKKHNESD